MVVLGKLENRLQPRPKKPKVKVNYFYTASWLQQPPNLRENYAPAATRAADGTLGSKGLADCFTCAAMEGFGRCKDLSDLFWPRALGAEGVCLFD
mmetsp:Transcript_224/g.806  ORF Transcript_224/g.806 Transcript_224/m.806 type:complete len:95 (-) Transcript_224:1904-2188(-)